MREAGSLRHVNFGEEFGEVLIDEPRRAGCPRQQPGAWRGRARRASALLSRVRAREGVVASSRRRRPSGGQRASGTSGQRATEHECLDGRSRLSL